MQFIIMAFMQKKEEKKKKKKHNIKRNLCSIILLV